MDTIAEENLRKSLAEAGVAEKDMEYLIHVTTAAGAKLAEIDETTVTTPVLFIEAGSLPDRMIEDVEVEVHRLDDDELVLGVYESGEEDDDLVSLALSLRQARAIHRALGKRIGDAVDFDLDGERVTSKA